MRLSLIRLACVGIFAAGLARYWVIYDPSLNPPEGYESFNLARNLERNGQFANPFSVLDTGPSAHLAPAYPAFLQVLMHWFGDGHSLMYACEWSAVIVMSAMLAMLPLLSSALGMGFFTGVVAAVVWLAAKPPTFPSWEVFYTGFLSVLGTYWFYRYITCNNLTTAKILQLGSVMGLLVLVNPVCAPVIAGWMIWTLWQRKLLLFKLSTCVIVLVPLLMLVPWTVRNYLVFKRVIFVRDNLGLELAVSNNDCASLSLEKNRETGCFETSHPSSNLAEAMRVLQLGEPRYNGARFGEAVHWIRTNPARFAMLCADRFVAFWLPSEEGTFVQDMLRPGHRRLRATIYLMTLLSVVGLAMLVRRDGKGFALCVLWLCLYPPIYYLVQFEDRYRFPIMWVTFLLGSLPIAIGIRDIVDSWVSWGVNSVPSAPESEVL